MNNEDLARWFETQKHILETAWDWQPPMTFFHDIQTRTVPAPLHLPSADECVRFERESFGALHQMLAGVSEAERPASV